MSINPYKGGNVAPLEKGLGESLTVISYQLSVLSLGLSPPPIGPKALVAGLNPPPYA